MTVVDGWYVYPGSSPAGWRVDIDFGSGWESVSEWCAGGVRQSGRRGPLDRFNASTLLVDFDNTDRRFSPWYDGPFGRPTRNMPIRLLGRSLTGLETPRFTGWIDRITERATPAGYAPLTVAHSLVRVSATDGFKRLARANGLGTTPAGDGELSGARIHRILDAAGWDADARFVDDGEVTMAETDLSRYALDELHDTALAEGGVFFISAAGLATFYDRASMTASLDPVTRFGTDGGAGTVPYGELGIEDTDEAIINTVRVARAGGTAYTAVDAGGVTADGPQTFVRTDLPIETDPQAEALAAVLLSRAVNASFVVGPIIIQPQTGGYQSWASAVGLGVTNPVSVAHGDGTAGFTILTRIDAINDRIGPGVWETVYTVSALDEPDSYEVIGPPYDLTATTSYTWIEWSWSIPLHGFDSIFVSFDGSPWVELPGDTDTYWTGALDPGTSHTLSVRGRKGLVDTGAISLTVSTAEAPIGPDPDDDGDFEVPDPPEDCTAPKGWVWRVDELVVGVWTEIDSGLWAYGIDPNTSWEPPGITFVAGQWYQITFQLYCDGAPEGDPIVYSWQEPADWDSPCDYPDPPDPAPVFNLEVCAATDAIKDIVTDFPMVQRELYEAPRPGPFDTDVAALCGPGFTPAPIASGYLADTAELGVMVPPLLNPELTVGLFVNFDSEPIADCPLITLGSEREFELRAIADTADVGSVRCVLSVKHPGGSGTLYTFDAAAGTDDQVPIAGWHSFAVTWGWEGSDAKLRLYVDGLPSGTVHTLTGDWTVRAHDSLVIWGGEPNSSFAHPAGWDSVLSAAEVEAIFTPPAALGTLDDEILLDLPVAFWKLDETSGVAAEDYGVVSPDADGVADVTWTAGGPQGDSYAVFDGSSDEITTATGVWKLGLAAQPGTAYTTEVAADTPVGWWKLDETSGTNAADSGSAADAGVYTNSPTLAARALPAPVGGSAPDFDGTNDYVNVGDNAAFEFGAGFTWEALVWHDANGAADVIVAKWDSNSGQRTEWIMYLDATGKVVAAIGNTGNTSWMASVSTLTVPLGKWSHVMARWNNAANTFTFQVNGVRETIAGSGTGSRGSGSAEVVTIAANLNGSTVSNVFDGSIAHVALYNSELSNARMDAHFDATGILAESLTIEALVNPDSVAGVTDQMIVAKYDSDANGPRDWGLSILGNDITATIFQEGATQATWRGITAADVLTTGWHHVVARFDEPANEWSIWVDGVEVATNTTAATGTRAAVSQSAVGIGAMVKASAAIAFRWDGALSRVALYNHALSDARIDDHYTVSGV